MEKAQSARARKEEMADLVYREYEEAGGFLAAAGAALERDEAVHGLMLGIALRLVDEPNAFGPVWPYMATVESRGGLRVAALMTPPFDLQLHVEGAPSPAELDLVVDGLLRDAWPVPGLLAAEPVAEAFAALWRQRTGAIARLGMRQRIYILRRVVHPRYPPGEFRPAALEEIEVVRQWAAAFQEESGAFGDPERAMRIAEVRVRNRTLFLWVDGEPASMAVRSRPTPHGEAVGLVYTPPDRRRRGYASAVVARLSQQLLDEGREFCTLYTNLANPTSNHIYQQIGYTPVADVVELQFEATR